MSWVSGLLCRVLCSSVLPGGLIGHPPPPRWPIYSAHAGRQQEEGCRDPSPSEWYAQVQVSADTQ